MPRGQFNLFQAGPALPDGLVYRPGFLSPREEDTLAGHIAELPLKPFEFQGFLGKRRVHSFGWQYVFDGSGLREAEPSPAWLEPVRARAEAFAGLDAGALAHVMINEYAPGAGIGWHRDRAVFGDVIGISLLAPARLRFRRKPVPGEVEGAGAGWERRSLAAEPRSAYLLRGPARSEWQHSVAALEALRYSITFRSLAGAAAA